MYLCSLNCSFSNSPYSFNVSDPLSISFPPHLLILDESSFPLLGKLFVSNSCLVESTQETFRHQCILVHCHINHGVPGDLEDSCRMRCIFRRHLSFTGQDKGQFCVKRIITTDSRPQIVTYSDEYNTSNQIKLKFCQSYLSPLRKYL